MPRVEVKWCDGPHGKQCRDRPVRAWRLLYCQCPCHDRRLIPVPARLHGKVAYLLGIAVVIAGLAAIEWWAGTHGVHR